MAPPESTASPSTSSCQRHGPSLARLIVVLAACVIQVSRPGTAAQAAVREALLRSDRRGICIALQRSDGRLAGIRSGSVCLEREPLHTAATPARPALAQRADDLRVIATRTLGGPNVWRLAPVAVAELHTGSLADVAPTEVPELAHRLRAALPTLVDDARGNEARSAAASSAGAWGDLL